MLAARSTTPALWMIATAHLRAWIGVLQQIGYRVGTASSTAPSLLSLSLLVLVFIVSLLLAVGASVWFTRRLETISDLFDLSPGLLSLLGALGANIPNYIASLVAAASGQLVVGLGIIIGSNIYNIAIILGISTFAAKAPQGIVLTRRAAQDVRVVATYTLAIMLTSWLAVWFLSQNSGATAPVPSSVLTALLIITNLFSLGLFGALSAHALHRVPHEYPATQTHTALLDEADPLPTGRRRRAAVRSMGEAVLALLLALGGVIVMVQTGRAFAVDVQLPPAILGLLLLAVATSLPNTVVAFTLARTARASACIEEVLSSNSINAALGIALPLLLWPSVQHDPLLIVLDAPLMVVLTLVAQVSASRQRVSRLLGLLLVLVYLIWVVVHTTSVAH